MDRTQTVAAACAFVFLACTLHAQSITASVTGRITDSSGAVISSARITVVNEDTNSRLESATNQAGIYYVSNLQPGTYRIEVEKTGFRTVLKPSVVLHVQDTIELNFNMAVGSVSESVTVTGGAPVLSGSAVVGTVVDRQYVESMPLNGRSFQSLIGLTPGVVFTGRPGSMGATANNGTGGSGQFSVNGQRSDSNSFVVDGVSANTGAAPGSFLGTQAAGNLPGLTALGTTHSLASVDEMQEFRVQTSNFSAEFGRQPGGQIAIVTRSGTNSYHGGLFEYLRNDVMDAANWFTNANRQTKPPERQNDFGGTFGGPVRIPRLYNGHDRTFFFTSYEGLRLRLPTFAITNVPTLCLRGAGSCAAGDSAAPAAIQPLLKAFPLPNGRDLGNGSAEFNRGYSNPSTLDATSIRLDHMLTSKWTLFGRYNIVPSAGAVLSPTNLAQLQENAFTSKTVTIGLTGIISPVMTNEFRFGWSGNDAHNVGRFNDVTYGAEPITIADIVPAQYATPEAGGNVAFSFAGSTVGTSGFQLYLNDIVQNQRQYNFVDNLTRTIGAHQLRFGVDWRRVSPYALANAYRVGITYLSKQSVLRNTSDNIKMQGSIPVRPIFTNFSAYLQDTWRASRRLTLDLGLRWDVNPPMNEADGKLPVAVTQVSNLATMQMAPYGKPSWKTTYANIAPRVGAAYQLIQRQGWETILRGGFGVFYDTGNAQAATGLSGPGSYPFSVSQTITTPQAYPLNPAAAAPIAMADPHRLTPPYGPVTAFDPNLKLPYTLHWNLALAQALGRNQSLTATYVGNTGRRLLQQRQYNLATVNPAFTFVYVTTNQAESNYDGLQVQFQRRLSHGIQALASYTWAHALDMDSTDNGTIIPVYGNSFYDVRHVFSSALTWDVPNLHFSSKALNALMGGWSLATNFSARTGFPVDLIGSTRTDPVSGALLGVRPNVVLGQPLYRYDSKFPGGAAINPAAFSAAPTGTFGNLGRNVARGLGMWTDDVALARNFRLLEKFTLQFRAEAFNVFNHPNFGSIQTSLTAANFGQATSTLDSTLSGATNGLSSLHQSGGPRSLQLSLRLRF